MAVYWTIFGILHFFSIALAVAVFFRLYAYIRRFRFEESKYTLLFGFVHLRWFMVAYFVSVGLWLVASLLLYSL